MMYFVTSEPLIFSTETGLLWGIGGPDANGVYGVAMRTLTDEAVAYVYSGTEQQCEDFILGMAGRLGAVNPEGISVDPVETPAEAGLRQAIDNWVGVWPIQSGEGGEPDDKRELLAEYVHTAWAGWMKYLFDKSSPMETGSCVIPHDLVNRWGRQMETPYADLPEDEKKSDRKEADEILGIMAGGE